MTEKTCLDCQLTLPLTSFHQYYSRGRKYYRQACKACWSERTKRYAHSPKGKIMTAKRNLRYYYNQRFGLTEEQYKAEYNQRYDEQEGANGVPFAERGDL